MTSRALSGITVLFDGRVMAQISLLAPAQRDPAWKSCRITIRAVISGSYRTSSDYPANALVINKTRSGTAPSPGPGASSDHAQRPAAATRVASASTSAEPSVVIPVTAGISSCAARSGVMILTLYAIGRVRDTTPGGPTPTTDRAGSAPATTNVVPVDKAGISAVRIVTPRVRSWTGNDVGISRSISDGTATAGHDHRIPCVHQRRASTSPTDPDVSLNPPRSSPSVTVATSHLVFMRVALAHNDSQLLSRGDNQLT